MSLAPLLPAFRAFEHSVMERSWGHLLPDVAVLYAREDSIYKSLTPHVYDIHRDARNYNGPFPVVAHPPCRAWGRLRHFSKPRADEKALGYHAVNAVRTWGGVLEHPAHSSLWTACELPCPGHRDAFGGFTVGVNQFDFGHLASKPTWLYVCSSDVVELPMLPLSLDVPTHMIGRSKTVGAHHFRSLHQAARERTPVAFAFWLLNLAARCAVGNQSGSVVTPGLSLMGETT